MTFVVGVQAPGLALVAGDGRRYTVDDVSGDVLGFQDTETKVRELCWGYGVTGGSTDWGEVMLDVLDLNTFEEGVQRLRDEAPDRMAKWDDLVPAEMLKHTFLYAAVREGECGRAHILRWDGEERHTFELYEPATCLPRNCDHAWFLRHLSTYEQRLHRAGSDIEATVEATRAFHTVVHNHVGPQGSVGPTIGIAVVGGGWDQVETFSIEPVERMVRLDGRN